MFFVPFRFRYLSSPFFVVVRFMLMFPPQWFVILCVVSVYTVETAIFNGNQISWEILPYTFILQSECIMQSTICPSL
jgi:hypothetical protein